MSITLKLKTPHPAQREIIAATSRFKVVDAGRRFGKSDLAVELLARPMIEGYPVGYFAPSYKLLAQEWREVERALGPAIAKRDRTEHRIELVTGGSLEMWSLQDTDAGRSRRYRRVIIDEAAMVRDLQTAWEQSISPTLTDFAGDAVFFSTPKGLNYFHSLYLMGEAKLDGMWESFRYPSAMNPHLPSEEIERQRRQLPERVFRQEYLAEFLEFEGAVFRHVAECATAIEQDEPIEGHQYAVAVDWGKSEDFTVIIVFDMTEKAMAHMTRFNQIDYQFQMPRLRAILDKWKPVVVKPERNSIGEPLVEQLLSWDYPVLPFVTTIASKQIIIDRLALAFEQGDIRIFDDDVMTLELMAYEGRRTQTNMMSYSAPVGFHDDTVMALALAWDCMEQTYDWNEWYGVVTCTRCGRQYVDDPRGKPCSFCGFTPPPPPMGESVVIQYPGGGLTS